MYRRHAHPLHLFGLQPQCLTGASLRQLNPLVNHSLLNRDVDSGYYSIHELIRQYALEGLREAGLFEEATQRHAAYYAQLLPDLGPSAGPSDYES